MNRLMSFVLRIKTLAAMVFSGLLCLYVAAGYLYAIFIHEGPFNFTVPFVFVLEGLVLSILISILWGVFFTDEFIKKWRYFPRLIVFSLIMMILLSVCVLVFVAIPTYWAKLWWIVIGAFMAGLVCLSVLCEIYFRATGKRYTEILKEYKAGVL